MSSFRERTVHWRSLLSNMTGIGPQRKRSTSGRLRSIRIAQIGRAQRLNSSHTVISYAVFCLKKKKWARDLKETLVASQGQPFGALSSILAVRRTRVFVLAWSSIIQFLKLVHLFLYNRSNLPP